MPPKIKGMTANIPPNPNPLKQAKRRFTLMISGEDGSDSGIEPKQHQDSPPAGLPQERFLLGDKLAIAPVLLLGQSNLTLDPDQIIACLQPVHLHATRDHLILMAQSQIDLTPDESAALLKEALSLIEADFQAAVLFQGQHAWFIPAGPFASLATHSIDQAHGRNIDWWMPRDTHESGIAKLWRKLQNEIQMLWHIGSVNEERTQKGLPSINSLWISGIGKLQDVTAPDCLQHASSLYGDHPLLAGLAKHLGIPHESNGHFSRLVNLESAGNIFAWVNKPQELWHDLSDALLNQNLFEVEIIDFPTGKPRQRIITARDLHQKTWAFWKKRTPLSWQAIVSGQTS
ncbi:hypothetical protein [Polynucleobacter brandtiae]|uniref:Cofactor-independent phosphoglycerate mutase n=1 Tax=Polynucleobacter brandtiae TaxID=1938816 RepID=A0A2M8VZ23_9BURK|nr:hypothetical protein [Polynucleobacter brandtiae]PJI83094.1 hypothetical protein B0G85_0485 [Polynucleobacter brandtiae]